MFAINTRKFVTHVKEGFANTFLSRDSVWICALTVDFIFKAFYPLSTREKCAYQKLSRLVLHAKRKKGPVNKQMPTLP